jgi:Lon protease-like protein
MRPQDSASKHLGVKAAVTAAVEAAADVVKKAYLTLHDSGQIPEHPDSASAAKAAEETKDRVLEMLRKFARTLYQNLTASTRCRDVATHVRPCKAYFNYRKLTCLAQIRDAAFQHLLNFFHAILQLACDVH